MHMKTVYLHAVLVDRLHHARQLIDGYTELGVAVSRRNLVIASGQNVRIQSHTTRVFGSVRRAELHERRQVIDVYRHAELHRLLYLIEANTVGRIHDLGWLEARSNCDLYFFNRDGVDAGTVLPEKF